MNSIEVTAMPSLRFAHIFSAHNYQNTFEPVKNFIEIAYVQEGSQEVEVGGKKYQVEKKDVICLIRDTPISIKSSDFHRHHTVGINIEWTYTDKNINGLILPVVTFAKNKTSDICNQIDWFIHNSFVCEQSPTKSAAAILDLLCKIDECNRKSLTDDLSGEYIYVYKAKKFINRHIYEPIEQKAIAKHLGITPGYLCSIFKKSENMTLMKYINTEKLNGVKTMINTKNIPLYEASAFYGYSDPNYVSRLYKQIFGFNITDVPNKR